MKQRTDEHGRAFAGSQLQIQIYVNRRPSELSRAIQAAIWGKTAPTEDIQWVSPLENEGFVEYQDTAFLNAIHMLRCESELASFWPRGGPVWDALGFLPLPGETASLSVILVEAKSYPEEMYGNGCRASGESRSLILESLAQTQQWYGISDSDWTGRLYQYANRLAHVYFFRNILRVEAWLANVCFLNDPRSPTTASQWKQSLADAKRELGFGNRVSYAVDVLLPAIGREELLAAPANSQER